MGFQGLPGYLSDFDLSFSLDFLPPIFLCKGMLALYLAIRVLISS